uniref:Uncharacterized protein n=1 Tax=Anguilla anguilla TaxID=7936 RepID=A0A0E9UIK9_ANGAN
MFWTGGIENHSKVYALLWILVYEAIGI